MKLDRIMENLAEGRSPTDDVIGEIRKAKAVLDSLEKNLKAISGDSPDRARHMVRINADQMIFAIQKISRATREL